MLSVLRKVKVSANFQETSYPDLLLILLEFLCPQNKGKQQAPLERSAKTITCIERKTSFIPQIRLHIEGISSC